MAANRSVRVVVVSHTYIVAANRGKLAALDEIPGYEVLALIPRTWRNRDVGQHYEVEAVSSGPLRVVALTAWSLGSGSLITYSFTALWRELRQFRPDVVHLEEEPWSLAALELALVCRVMKIPLTFFTWENADRPLRLPFRIIRTWFLRQARAALAGNAAAKALLERHGFAKDIEVLPQLGVDTVAFQPPAEGPPRNTLVGFVGRLVRQKGLFQLLEAAARLPAQVRVMLVGNGPLSQELRSRAASLGFDQRLEVNEGVPHKEVPRYLQRMSVLVLPSLSTPTWKEQFGHVLIEAMACGVPVIGSDSGAIPEVIGDAGLVVPEGNVESLAAALLRLLSTPSLQAELAARGRARVLEAYTNEVIAGRLASFLARVMVGVS